MVPSSTFFLVSSVSGSYFFVRVRTQVMEKRLHVQDMGAKPLQKRRLVSSIPNSQRLIPRLWVRPISHD